MPDDKIRLPNSTNRIAVVGRTGSGKTIVALWHLSNANFDVMPWVIIDYKTDENINRIERAQYIGTDANPTQPGIYILQPEPDDDSLADFLTRVWQRGNTGIYVDEGYMMSENSRVETRFKTLLTQGRSKRIPMIVLSQRPVWISRFVWSESEFIQVLQLSSAKDAKAIEDILPPGAVKRIPDFHSIYFDVGKNRLHYLSPVPDEDTIIERINERLRPIRKRI